MTVRNAVLCYPWMLFVDENYGRGASVCIRKWDDDASGHRTQDWQERYSLSRILCVGTRF